MHTKSWERTNRLWECVWERGLRKSVPSITQVSFGTLMSLWTRICVFLWTNCVFLSCVSSLWQRARNCGHSCFAAGFAGAVYFLAAGCLRGLLFRTFCSIRGRCWIRMVLGCWSRCRRRRRGFEPGESFSVSTCYLLPCVPFLPPEQVSRTLLSLGWRPQTAESVRHQGSQRCDACGIIGPWAGAVWRKGPVQQADIE